MRCSAVKSVDNNETNVDRGWHLRLIRFSSILFSKIGKNILKYRTWVHTASLEVWALHMKNMAPMFRFFCRLFFLGAVRLYFPNLSLIDNAPFATKPGVPKLDFSGLLNFCVLDQPDLSLVESDFLCHFWKTKITSNLIRTQLSVSFWVSLFHQRLASRNW